ncbi:antibiotic biosynthesis monooxygenase [Candidatus Marsarchaeota archaeon]|nr:antibiotic biosynthesis monooxygenase [Candidatus Marsarchaeota archaeon]
MINVGMYYSVRPGHEAEFEGAFSAVVGHLKGSGVGIKDAKLYKEVGKSEYMIYTEWDGLESFKNFVQSRSFNDTVSQGRSIIDGRPRHRIFTDIKEQ